MSRLSGCANAKRDAAVPSAKGKGSIWRAHDTGEITWLSSLAPCKTHLPGVPSILRRTDEQSETYEKGSAYDEG